MNIIEEKYQWAGSLTKRTKIDMIVLHHAEASVCSAQNIHSWHLGKGYSGIGYHFFIRKDGSIYRGRPENTIGAHAKGYNTNSIGICFEGRYQKEIMPDIQIKAGQELIAYLKHKYDISIIMRHKDVNATDCPGQNFPFDKFAQEKENLILSFQQAAIKDSFKFPKYGADGMYGDETETVMKKCVVKKRYLYRYKNATRLVQRLLGLPQDGLAGPDTDATIRNFQKENGLRVDGAVGLNTWKVLLKIK